MAVDDPGTGLFKTDRSRTCQQYWRKKVGLIISTVTCHFPTRSSVAGGSIIADVVGGFEEVRIEMLKIGHSHSKLFCALWSRLAAAAPKTTQNNSQITHQKRNLASPNF